MGDVTSISTGRPVGEPVQDVIDVLESLLSDARAGRLRAVVVAEIHADGTTAYTHAWEANVDSVPIVAASAISHERVLRALVKDH